MQRPPLHPQRIAQAMRVLMDWDIRGDTHYLSQESAQTCLAALKIMQRSQVAIGITADVADLGVSVRKLVGAAAQVIKRKR